jgi:hypothetical protein
VRISKLNLRSEAGIIQAEAYVTWEEVDKPPLLLFVETGQQFHDALWTDPNAFLLACLLPAWQTGERRVQIDGSLCPVLCQNMRVALATLQSWYPELGPPPVIEPSLGFKAYLPFQTQAVSLLSCGIDSLATLRWNKLHLPFDHPGSITGVIVMAFNGTPSLSSDELYRRDQGRLSAAARVAANAGVDLIPVTTNMWWLVDDGYFYDEKWHGAVSSSLASFCSKRFHKIYIASSFDATRLHPWGSHPLLDPYYSSAHCQIEHHGVGMSRFEKTALVAEWSVALQNIRVCQNDDTGQSNCGTCEKCIRTMTALVALGKLKGCDAFPENDVSTELLGTIEEYTMIKSDYDAAWYQELIPALTQCGRNALVFIIEKFSLAHAKTKAEASLLAGSPEAK